MRLFAAFSIACLCTVRLAAQTPATTGSVTGVVRDTLHPIAGVEIALRPGNVTTRTDSAGRFTIPSTAPGDYIVRARSIGYLPVDVNVHVRAGERAETDIVFRKAFTALDPVVVSAKMSCQHFRVDGFACRRAQGQGVFFDFIDIAKKHPEQIGDIFRGVDGFRVDYKPFAASRAPDSPLAKPGPIAMPISTVGLRCLRVLVDGRAVSLANQMPESPDEIAAVEIYKSSNDVPLYYRTRSMCAVAIYWTWAGMPKSMRQ